MKRPPPQPPRGRPANVRDRLERYLRPLLKAGWQLPAWLLSQSGDDQPRRPPFATIHHDIERGTASTFLSRIERNATAVVIIELSEVGVLRLSSGMNPNASPENRARIRDAVPGELSISAAELAERGQPERFYREVGLLP